MTYDPHTRTNERDVIVTTQGPNYGGMVIAVVLVVLAILAAVWLFSNDGGGTTADTTPVETTLPTETTAPADTTPTTTAP